MHLKSWLLHQPKKKKTSWLFRIQAYYVIKFLTSVEVHKQCRDAMPLFHKRSIYIYMARFSHHIPVLGLFPARIRDISNPRLNAWLNMRRVWKVDTKGNHEKNATGMKMSIPIPASYNRARDRTDFHNPSFFT